MLKIRTMYVDAEVDSGPQWSVKADPRVTRVGRVLRFLHLDEIPQLINVIKGEMTIIGPRPERPDIVNVLSDHVDNYTDRLIAKPGITGLAQVYLPPDETLDCVRKKVCFDRAYIDTASATVDLQIWFCTILRMLGIRKGHGPKWMGLDRKYRAVIRRCADFHDASEAFELDCRTIDPDWPAPPNEEQPSAAVPVCSVNDNSDVASQEGRGSKPR